MLALNVTNTGYAKNLVMPHKHFTLQQRIQWQRKIIRHDRWVIRTRVIHRSSLVNFSTNQLRWTRLELRQSLAQLSSSSLVFGSLSSTWPLHHSLWSCIHNHEASDWQNNDTGHNGHYGGLQMHPGWGYGTSYYASNDSQFIQERAAENGYAASGYSKIWLMGQWYHPDCLKYA